MLFHWLLIKYMCNKTTKLSHTKHIHPYQSQIRKKITQCGLINIGLINHQMIFCMRKVKQKK